MDFSVGFLCTGFKGINDGAYHIWKGGESEALIRLQRHLEQKAFIATYSKPKMTPKSLLASPTGLAPYLRFGCLSTRLFFSELNDLYQKVNGTTTTVGYCNTNNRGRPIKFER